MYNDDIDLVSDEETSQGKSGDVGSDGGDVGSSSAANVGCSDVPGSSIAVPLKEELYTPP